MRVYDLLAQGIAGTHPLSVWESLVVQQRTRTGERIRVVLADDHPVVRDGLRALLQGDDFDVVSEVGSGREAVDAVHALDPDVVLMDIRMPDMDGLTATRLVKKANASTAVVIVTSFDSNDYLREAIDAGAAGYVLKGSPRDDVVRTIRVVVDGGAIFEPSLLRNVLNDAQLRASAAPEGAREALDSLSEREHATLRLIAQGMTNQAIASELSYSVGTIKNTVKRIIDKMGVSDRTQAAVHAVRAGIDAD